MVLLLEAVGEETLRECPMNLIQKLCEGSRVIEQGLSSVRAIVCSGWYTAAAGFSTRLDELEVHHQVSGQQVFACFDLLQIPSLAC